MQRFDDSDIQNFIQGNDNNNDEPRALFNDNVTLFNRIWVTEVHAPEILAYESSLVEELKSHLATQQDGVNTMLDLAVENENSDENFTSNLYQMDIERIRYSIARYLRTRLLKIENNLDFLIQHPDIFQNRLSENEQTFALSLYNLTNRHVEDTIFNSHFENNPDFRQRIESSDDKLKHSTPSLQVCIFMMYI